jgi:UDP-N-acetylmuramyl pentapeptide phosphotransferase/UDP-N-acetylglucosamine-1-phosphate transferase
VTLPVALILFLSGLLSWLLLWWLIPVLRQRLPDLPNARSSHRSPTPRGGGLAFVVVATLLTPLFGQGVSAWIPVVCAPLALVGVLDDRYNLPAIWRYLAQLCTALVLMAMSTLSLPWWSLPLVLLAVTAIINFFNFMDGLDGLVASCGAVLMLVSGQWVLAGALLGFLLWNWSPARIFMGDVGSTYLGAVFAGLVLQRPQPLQALLLLLVATPLLADAFLCVLRRWHAGQQIFQAHRLHLYQRLHRAGWPHATVSIFYLLQITLLALGFVYTLPLPIMLGAIFMVLLLGIWLDQKQASPFSGASEKKQAC